MVKHLRDVYLWCLVPHAFHHVIQGLLDTMRLVFGDIVANVAGVAASAFAVRAIFFWVVASRRRIDDRLIRTRKSTNCARPSPYFGARHLLLETAQELALSTKRFFSQRVLGDEGSG